MAVLKRMTRRRPRVRPTNVLPAVYDRLFYLGSGSYGSVYEIPDTNTVLKEHRIFTMDNISVCEDWRREFDVQTAVYNACMPALLKFQTRIVRPYVFSSASRNAQNRIVPQATVENANSCFFTMDRVPGLATASPCFLQKLAVVLRPDVRLAPAHIPPYLCLGSLTPMTGHITLDMLQGSQRVEFPNESYNYCLTDGVALYMLRAMFLTFFTIADHGFIPRDVEFVFDGACTDTYISVLDFNEVKTVAERSSGRPAYDVDVDLAHVYIDLCGLRSSRDANPEAPYDAPTPQWKFLCSLLVSPYAFFACVETAVKQGFRTFNIERIVMAILSYVERSIRMTAPPQWTPTQSEFTHDPKYADFDRSLQMYYVHALLATAQRRGVAVADIPTAYKDAIQFIQSLLDTQPSRFEMVADDDEWNSLWATAAAPTVTKNNTTPRYARRRFTAKKHG